MIFELYEMEGLSGEKIKIFSPLIEGETDTLYEKFVRENQLDYKKEVENLDTRLEIVGKEVGLYDEFFKTGAGKFGQNICSFRDRPGSKLRLFFIEYGNILIILGGGGVKPKSVRTTQGVPKLQTEVNLLGLIADTLRKAEKKGHFGIDEDGCIFSTTNYAYNTDNYE